MENHTQSLDFENRTATVTDLPSMEKTSNILGFGTEMASEVNFVGWTTEMANPDSSYHTENAVTSYESWTMADPRGSNESLPLLAIASSLYPYKVALAMHAYWLPVTIFLGLIGNTLSLLVMLQKHNRTISCCNYMAALAISDNIMLLNALDYWSVSFPSRPLSNPECKAMAWLFQANSFMSMTLIFSMTVDRFLAVRFPFRAITLCSTKRARITIACIILLSLLYTLPYLFTSSLIPEARTCVAVITKDTLSVAYNWVNIFLGSIVPFVGLLTMNALIVVTIRNRGKFLKEEETSTSSTKDPSHDDTTDDMGATKPSPSSGQRNPGFEQEASTEMSDVSIAITQEDPVDTKSPNMMKTVKKEKDASTSKRFRDNQLTVMLLLVTFTFLLLTLPQYARYLVAILWNYAATPDSYANYILIAHLSNKLFYTNNACNFFLYCLSGSKFRNDLAGLFSCRK